MILAGSRVWGLRGLRSRVNGLLGSWFAGFGVSGLGVGDERFGV